MPAGQEEVLQKDAKIILLKITNCDKFGLIKIILAIL